MSYEVDIKKKRIKNIYIKITSNNIVELSVPHGITQKEIEEILESKKDWIEKGLEKKEKKYKVFSKKHIYILGNRYDLSLVESEENKVVLHDTTLTIYSKNKTFSKLLNSYLKSKFVELAETLLQVYKEKFSIKYSNIYYKNNYRTLGSCSRKNDIMLSYRLYMLPIEAIEYVIAHELAHIKHKNHSRIFYAELEKLLPKYKIYKKEISKFDLRGDVL